MEISQSVRYIGVNDYNLDLFEGQYPCPNGMAYNSYVIVDKKIAVIDGVDGAFEHEWLQNLKNILQGKTPDYFIVHHVEPDHSGSVMRFAQAYPNTKIVASKQAFLMMNNYFGQDFENRRIVVGNNDEIVLGEHTLRFFSAPMVHWPEVLISYETTEKILFSADAFGTFGATDKQKEWTSEARRYYFNIVGKFGVQVQNLLQKISALPVRVICPLHGRVLQGAIDNYLKLYDTWSKYQAEEKGVLIAYTSVYGNTARAVGLLQKHLQEKGQETVVCDLARCDTSAALAQAFRFDKLVLASTTYNGGVFPFMRSFIAELKEHNFQNRKVGFIENGTWSPFAQKAILDGLDGCKNLTFCTQNVRIFSAMNTENERQIRLLADELLQ